MESMDNAKKYDVYIIYRKKDQDVTRAIAELLQSVGKRVFFDVEELSAGNFSKQIFSALEHSSSYIVLLSEGCMDHFVFPGDWWAKEVAYAIQSGKKVIPVNIEDSFKTDGLRDVPADLSPLLRIQWMSFYRNQTDRFANEILSLLDGQIKEKEYSHDVFLAYPRVDLKAAEKLCKAFETNGFSVWRDIDGIYTCDDFEDVTAKAISSSKVFIAIYSSWALESLWFKQELAFAQQKKIPIIKVLTDTPEGLSAIRRMALGSMLDMGGDRFEEKLLSSILNYGCKPDTTEMSSLGKDLYEDALKTNDLQEENRAFCILMRAAELGDNDALSYIESKPWNINLADAVSRYVPINGYYVHDMRADLYNQGEIIAEDETLSDNAQRGRGMEKAAFSMMRRAIDLGHDGNDPTDYDWYFLEEKDFEECLNMLGNSSKMYLRKRNKANAKKKANMSLMVTSNIRESESNMGSKIFISYKRVDKDIVLPIKDEIEQKTGNRCWIDLDGIESDAQFANVIIRAINNAQVFLFMYSHAHTEIEDYDTDWTVREINFAQKRRKRIVFVNIDGSPLTDWFELMFGTKQQIDTSSDFLMNRLFVDLKKWLNADETVLPPKPNAGDTDNHNKGQTLCTGSLRKEFQLLLSFKHKDRVEAAVFSPDGKHIASASDDNSLCIWDATNGHRLSRLKGHDDSVICIAYNSGGTQIVSASDDETIRIWDTTSGTCLLVLSGHDDSIWSVSYSQDDKYIVSASVDSTVKIWNVETGVCVKTFLGHTNDVNYASFSPDGQNIVSASEDGTIRIWNAKDGSCSKILRDHQDGVWFAKYSRDGKYIVSASADCTIRIWDASVGECIKILTGHTDDVNSASFSTDGQFIVSSSDDKTIRVWNVSTGKCLQTIKAHQDFVNTAFFSPDDNRIVSASDDCTIKVWS